MKTKTLNQIRAQYYRLLDADNGVRTKLINKIYWRYKGNILAYLGTIFDTTKTAGDIGWLASVDAATIIAVDNTPVEAEIYTYQD